MNLILKISKRAIASALIALFVLVLLPNSALAAADITVASARITSSNTVLVTMANPGHNLASVDFSKWHIDQATGGSGPLDPASAVVTSPTLWTVTLTFSGTPFSATDSAYDASHGLYVEASGVTDTNGDTNAVVAHGASTAITDGQVPVISSVTPAASASIRNTSNASDISYTLSEALTSGSITITRTSGTDDTNSPHTCTFNGTALATGAHAAFDISATTNGCTVAHSLVRGAVYTFVFAGTDTSSNAATAITSTGVTLLSRTNINRNLTPVTTTSTVVAGDTRTQSSGGSSSNTNSNTNTSTNTPAPAATPTVTVVIPPAPVVQTVSVRFNSTLSSGAKGSDVSALQEWLAKDKTLYPEGTVSGYYGALTRAAVIRFQIKNGIIKSSGDVGAGVVGPKTRAALNASL